MLMFIDALAPIPWLHWWWLFPTVFLAGFVDSIAGGGGLITMPAYLIAGFPAQALLGTNKFISCVGTAASTARYIHSRRMHWPSVWLGLPCTCLGAMLGAHTAARFDPAQIKRIVLVMLPIAAALVLVPRRQHTEIVAPPPLSSWRWRVGLPLVASALGWYDGVFGPGAGTLIVLGLHGIVRLPFLQSAAVARMLNFFTNAAALITFAWYGQVWYAVGIPLALAGIAGHGVGSHIALQRGTGFIRGMLALACALLVIYLVLR